jgi:hypothetical protein
VLFAAFLLLTVLIQVQQNAYQSELTGWPDEPSHYVTGVLIREYLLTGIGQNPIRFAENFYIHYPKVSFGMWPPLFHITEGVWTLLFGPSRVSVLFFMAVITALTALSLAAFLIWKGIGAGLSVAAGVLFCLLPVVSNYTSVIGPDGLAALAAIWATWFFIRFLESGDYRYGLQFGFAAGFALLTKGNCMALAPMPLIAVLFTRRWDILKNPWFYISGLIAGAMSVPWFLATTRTYMTTIEPEKVTAAHVAKMAIEYPFAFAAQMGWLLLPLLGGVALFLLMEARRVDPFWASWVGLMIGFYCFHIAVALPGVEPRYLLIVLAPSLLFVAGCLDWMARRVSSRWAAPAMALLVPAVFWAADGKLVYKYGDGTGQAAEAILSQKDSYKDSILVSSDNLAEGTFITEVLMRADAKRREDYLVLRASRWISQSTWNGKHYQMLISGADELESQLSSAHVRYLVLDDRPGQLPHHQLIQQTVRERADRFQLIGRYGGTGTGVTQSVYCYHKEFKGTRVINIPMPFTLQKNLQLEP